MRVSYDCALDELVATSLERYRGQRTVRGAERAFGVSTAILLGIAIGAPVGGTAGALAGLAAAGASLLVYGAAVARLQRAHMRRTWRRFLAGETALRVQAEVMAEGLRIRYGERDTVWPWAEVLGAAATSGGVEIYTQAGPLLLVPQRAFADVVESAAFREQVEQRGAAARRG